MGNNICSSCTASPKELSNGLTSGGGKQSGAGLPDASLAPKAAAAAAVREGGEEARQHSTPPPAATNVKVNGCQQTTHASSQQAVTKVKEEACATVSAQCHDEVEAVSQSDVTISHVASPHADSSSSSTDVTGEAVQHHHQKPATSTDSADIAQHTPPALTSDVASDTPISDSDVTAGTIDAGQGKLHNGEASPIICSDVTAALKHDMSIDTSADIEKYAEEYIHSLLFVITQVLYPLLSCNSDSEVVTNCVSPHADDVAISS